MFMPGVEKWVLLSTKVDEMGRRLGVPLNVKFFGDDELEVDSFFE